MTTPRGYEVGTAFIQVLPSFRNFQRKSAAAMAGLRDVKVNVEPQVAVAKAKAAVKELESQVARPVSKPVDLDKSKFDARMRELEAKRAKLIINIDADVSKAHAKIAELERKRGNTKIDVDAEIAKAKAKIAYLTSRRDSVNIDVDMDIDKAEEKLRRVEQDVKRLGSTQANINIEAEDASRAIAMIGALTIAIGGLGAVAPAAAAAVALIPTAILAAGQGIGALAAGFNGTGDAVKAMQAVDDEAIGRADANTRQRVSMSRRIASANSSLQSALEHADRASVQGAQQVLAARDALATAQTSAARRVQDAEENLTQTQRSARDAQEALTRARKDEADRLQSLRLSVSGAALDEEAAVLAVHKAQERLNAAREAGLTGDPMQEIDLAARQAQQSLAEVGKRYRDLKAEAAQADRVGVEGSDQVTAAQRRVQDSATAVTKAERDLRDTRVDSARQVTQAQKQVAQAQQQSAQAQSDAARQVADAQRAVADASEVAGAQGTAAMDKLTLAMSKLTPEGRAFATFLQRNVKPALHDIGDSVQAAMLPQMEKALGRLMVLVPTFRDGLAGTGKVLGDLADQGAVMMTTGPWRADFKTILSANSRLLSTWGQSLLSTLDATRSLTVASIPLAETFARGAEVWLNGVNASIQHKRATGELAVEFQHFQDRLQEVWSIVKEVAGALWSVTKALAPMTLGILHAAAQIIGLIGSFAEANPLIFQMIGWLVVLGSGFLSLGRSIGGMRSAVATSLNVFRGLRTQLFGAKDGADVLRSSMYEVTTQTDATGKAMLKLSPATDAAGAAASRTVPVMTRFKGVLGEVHDAYTRGADNAGRWATRVTGAAGTAAAGITVASGTSIRSLDGFLPATGRVEGAFSALRQGAANHMTTLTRVVGGTAAAVTSGLGKAVTGLVGALGGPFGLVMAGAAVGLGFLADNQARAAEQAAVHKAAIQTLVQALEESNGVVDESVRKKIEEKLVNDSLIDNTNALGLSTQQLVDDILAGGGAGKQFTLDLEQAGQKLLDTNKIGGIFGGTLKDMVDRLVASGGAARDHAADIRNMGIVMQGATGATDAQRDAFTRQLTQLLDLAAGYHNSSGDFREATQKQDEIADAHRKASESIDRQRQAFLALNDAVLGNVDKNLALRNASLRLEQAQNRTAKALKEGGKDSEAYREALLAEEQASLDVVRANGEMALSNSKATNDVDKKRDATIAEMTAAANLANTYSGPLPAALQQYIDKVGIARDVNGLWVVDLNKIPPARETAVGLTNVPEATAATDAYVGHLATIVPTKTTDLFMNTAPAVQAALDFKTWFDSFLGTITGTINLTTPPGANLSPFPSVGSAPVHKALGGILRFARGGMLRPMAAGLAQVVGPNTWRVIGDRSRDPEAYIPINDAPRSQAILAEAAGLMGFGIAPMAAGGILRLATGAVVGPGAGADISAALPLTPDAVAALARAVDDFTTKTLPALASELAGQTTTTLGDFQTQLGVTSVASLSSLDFAARTTVMDIGLQLATLRTALQITSTAFALTADSVGVSWARIREYAAAPVRSVLSGPYNSGLIAAWNGIDAFFSLNRPLAPVAIPFATGGPVPGVGNTDKVPLLATPGEYIISKPVVKKWGLANIHAAHMATRRGGFPGLEGMLAGDERGIFRIGFASGGPVPEALARATAFGRSMHGKPYIWGGNSEAGTDCSGWMAMIARALLDVKPYARREWATAETAGGTPPPRFAPGIDGTFAIGVTPGVHTAGTLAGTNVESGGSHGNVAFGPPSAGADNAQFPLKFHLAELGGNFVSGGAGGGFDISAFIRDKFAEVYRAINAYQAQWGQLALAQAGATLVGRSTDAAVNWAASTISPVGTTGNVESWRPLVLQALSMLNLPAAWADITLRRLAQESGGNARAQNNWDVNAKRGDPSKGLMQVIGSTFRSFRDTRAPDDVFDPLANMLAAMRYGMHRYGSLPAAFGRPGGYDDGGFVPPGYTVIDNRTRAPEALLNGSQWNAIYAAARQGSGGGQFSGQLYLDSGELLGVVRGEISRSQGAIGMAVSRRTR